MVVLEGPVSFGRDAQRCSPLFRSTAARFETEYQRIQPFACEVPLNWESLWLIFVNPHGQSVIKINLF